MSHQNSPSDPPLDYGHPATYYGHPAAYSRGFHWLAILTAVSTFPLIFMGGLVTSHGAGMAVPDWPNSFGYNMFLFPPSAWVAGIFFEHVHRLIGTVVGFAAILLALRAWGFGQDPVVRRRLWMAVALLTALAAACAIVAPSFPKVEWPRTSMRNHLLQAAVGAFSLALILAAATVMRRPEPRRWVRWLAFGVLLAVIAQGILGGLRVIWVNLDLAIVHGCFGQAFFCLAGLMVAATSRWWVEREGKLHVARSVGNPHPGLLPKGEGEYRSLYRLAVVAVVLIYLQLIAGAVMRHYQAGLAIPDLPGAYGRLIPPTTADELTIANKERLADDLNPVTLPQIWIHFTHRMGAIAVTVGLVILIVRALRRHVEEPLIRRPALALIVLLAAQLALGVLTVAYRKPAEIASGHVAVGALILYFTFYLAVRARRLGQTPQPAVIVGEPHSLPSNIRPATA